MTAEIMVKTSLETRQATAIVAKDSRSPIPTMDDRTTEELVIAVVGPVGSGCTEVVNLLESELTTDYGYSCSKYKLSDLIRSSAHLLGGNAVNISHTGSKRIGDLQSVGNQLRDKFGNGYLAAKAIEQIARWRDAQASSKSTGGITVAKRQRHVHFIDSLKNPAELDLLRKTYGDMFWLIGVFAPPNVRHLRLTNQMGLGQADLDAIMRHDYSEPGDSGQKVQSTFYQADVFIRNDQANDTRLKETLKRAVEVLFGFPIHTPTIEEASMYAAYAEAAGSACLSRQVGAVIINSRGEVIGRGRNDVPKFDGGLYGAEHGALDHRCYRWGGKLCHNDERKRSLYADVYGALHRNGFLREGVTQEDVVTAVSGTEMRSLIEFSRAVHAEMEAIVSVARNGNAGLAGATMYCTTYPCHPCARHIVASGIHKVVYIEPYPKSLATKLHNDAISESENDIGKSVVFLQYMGIAPKHVLRLFKTSVSRKDKDGHLTRFDKRIALPAVRVSLDDYATHEKYVVNKLAEDEEKLRDDRQSTLF